MEIIKFGSAFCSPCKMLDSFLSANELNVTSYDADVEGGLVDKYRIRAVPTLIKVVEGKEVDRVIGFHPTIKDRVKELFNE